MINLHTYIHPWNQSFQYGKVINKTTTCAVMSLITAVIALTEYIGIVWWLQLVRLSGGLEQDPSCRKYGTWSLLSQSQTGSLCLANLHKWGLVSCRWMWIEETDEPHSRHVSSDKIWRQICGHFTMLKICTLLGGNHRLPRLQNSEKWMKQFCHFNDKNDDEVVEPFVVMISNSEHSANVGDLY